MMFYCRQGIIGLFFIFSDLIISLSPGLKSEVRKYWNTKNFAARWRRKRISPGRSRRNKTFLRICLKRIDHFNNSKNTQAKTETVL